ncbi:MAG: alpha-mannosidase, partial [Clostridia bacterium]|nr:alpha-mannosidase [Clostridia bacterium]
EYLTRLSLVKGGRFDRDISMAADGLIASLKSDGVITDAAAQFAEKVLVGYSEECKKTKVICVGHAHIDMNWMWGFQETAGLTVDTFRTVLNLMREYPEFTFAQSQASVYRIVEEYAPWMMEEMKLRIREGRWEVTASTWVETDKNMPSGESLTRHILNTKEYMSRVWGLDPDSLQIDFEPDTFGHSLNVPEICANGGVKYYYHCRGFADEGIYRWVGPSGAELLCYRDVKWYNGPVSSEDILMAPEFCHRYGVDTMLKLVGCGDHGGGPTRRDIERLNDIASWPLAPDMRWGTFAEYFALLEKNREKLPVFKGEKNFIFTGCYTSQSRIKMANRIGEARLADGEFLAAGANLVAGEDLSGGFDGAWEKILFNHFHDILPGSGKVDTREYAMGDFQKALAAVNTASTRAMAAIAEHIDVSLLHADGDRLTVSEGAGVGYTLGQDRGYALPKTERGSGKTRAFVVYNTVNQHRSGPVELTVWDWQGDISAITVLDHQGKPCVHKVIEVADWYWDHRYVRLEADLDVPPLGWTVCWVTEGEGKLENFGEKWFGHNDRMDEFTDDNIVLDNGILRAEFERVSGRLVSLKKGGTEYVSEPSCKFEYIEEDTVHGMTSWRVGHKTLVEDVNEKYPIRIEKIDLGAPRKSFSYTVAFRASKIRVTVSLADKAENLEFAVNADWHEIGSDRTPSLVFSVPFAYPSDGSLCDVPMGFIKRPVLQHDIPCLSFCGAKRSGKESGEVVYLTADTKYGFRNDGKTLSVSLIRASSDPDPYPELGIHDIRLGVGVCEGKEDVLMGNAARINRGVAVCSVKPHVGSLAPKGSLVSVRGAELSALKVSQKDGKTVVRVYNPTEKPVTAKIELLRRPGGAWLTDSLEREQTVAEIVGNGAEVKLVPYGMATIKFAK